MNSKNKFDINKIRSDTPCRNTYMDNAGASVPPLTVTKAIEKYYREIVEHGPKSNWVREHYGASFINDAKKPIAELINANPEEIAFTLNGSDAISILANGINIKRSENIVISELGFICNTIPWLRLRETHGIEVRIVKANKPGFVDIDNLQKQVDHNTKIVAIDHMPPNLGTLQPVKEISEITHERKSLFFLNACNTVGLVNVDVHDIDCDFMAVTGRKYLRGPSGTGFLYVKKRHISNIKSSYLGWKTGIWDWNNDVYEDSETIDRFSTGEPNTPGIVGLLRAVEYIQDIGGISEIDQRVFFLTEYLVENLKSIPNIKIYGPESANGRAGLVTFNLGDLPSSKLCQYLNRNNVVVQASHFFCPGTLKMFGTESVVRIALHYWNTKEEIDKVLDLLDSYPYK